MHAVLLRVLEMLFHSAERPDSVLAFGFARRKLFSEGLVTGAPSLDAFFPNTLHNYLQSPPWLQLLVLAGDVSIDHHNFVQLCGPAFSECTRPQAPLKRLSLPSVATKSASEYCPRDIFFSRTRHEKLPGSHPFEHLHASRTGASALLHHLFAGFFPLSSTTVLF
jgi:hypothetical protein